MIVNNTGYISHEKVIKMIQDGKRFAIYKTNKGTEILVKEAFTDNIELYLPKYDRLPYKLLEGKRINNGTKVFNSKTDDISMLDVKGWNNGNQIMSYNEFNN